MCEYKYYSQCYTIIVYINTKTISLYNCISVMLCPHVLHIALLDIIQLRDPKNQ